jgi:dihydroflavonol-4-reductase
MSQIISRKPSSKKLNAFKLIILFILLNLSFTPIFSQDSKKESDTTKFFISMETDPAFWAGTLPQGLGFDGNLDFRLSKLPQLRFGILGYSGKWGGCFGKSILLSKDFTENNWVTQWNGIGIEAQYQIRFGLKRGGLQPGLRFQWNQFKYNQENSQKGSANHFVITPQVGFQWFPFNRIGLYVLPWAGVQIPLLGTDKIMINGKYRETRKIMPVLTAHIGWEFKF